MKTVQRRGERRARKVLRRKQNMGRHIAQKVHNSRYQNATQKTFVLMYRTINALQDELNTTESILDKVMKATGTEEAVAKLIQEENDRIELDRKAAEEEKKKKNGQEEARSTGSENPTPSVEGSNDTGNADASGTGTGTESVASVDQEKRG